MEKQQISLTLRFFEDQESHEFYQNEQPNHNCCLFPNLPEEKDIAWINDCFSPEAIKPLATPEQDTTIIRSTQAVNQPKEKEKLLEKGEEVKELKNKSIFHNLQKHLIAFLKRVVVVKRVDLIQQPAGLKAYELWKIFKAGKDYNKKGLYLVVGTAEAKNRQNVNRMARQHPELQKMMSKASFGQIEQAQAILRKSVLAFLSRMTKQDVQDHCKMAKFDSFYTYLLGFMDELRGDGISQRMKKDQKLNFLKEKASQKILQQENK